MPHYHLLPEQLENFSNSALDFGFKKIDIRILSNQQNHHRSPHVNFIDLPKDDTNRFLMVINNFEVPEMKPLKNLFFDIPMNKIADAVHSWKQNSNDDRGNVYFDYLVSSDQNQGRIHHGDGVPFPRPRKIEPALQPDEELLIISFLEKLSAIFEIKYLLYLIPAVGRKDTFLIIHQE